MVSAHACGLKQAQGGDMTGDQFARLLNEFTLSAESGDGARFAGHFTEDAIYYDYIYGAHKGRAEIAHSRRRGEIQIKDGPSSPKWATTRQPSLRQGLPSRNRHSLRRLVEPGGIEPPTSSLRTTRSPS
jgi:hypothetical protein